MSRVDRKSYGGHSERETPGPIPNPEVKPFSADGTATERLWESRTPPDILVRRAIPKGMALLPFPGFFRAETIRRGSFPAHSAAVHAALPQGVDRSAAAVGTARQGRL